MKKIVLTYFFILCTLLGISKSVQVDGYFIRKSTKEKVVTKVFVPIGDDSDIQFHFLQWSFRAIDAFSAIDIRYYPSDILEYGFNYNKVDYCFYAISNIFNLDNGRSKFQDRKTVFIRIDVKGYCKLFSCYKLNTLSSDLSGAYNLYDKIPCLKANDKPWFIFEEYLFSKDVAEYFKDNQALSNKISSGQYKKKDLEKIVIEYNQWKQKK